VCVAAPPRKLHTADPRVQLTGRCACVCVCVCVCGGGGVCVFVCVCACVVAGQPGAARAGVVRAAADYAAAVRGAVRQALSL
jgi:hypothetical protein